MEKQIPWERGFEGVSTRPLTMAGATAEHKRAIEQLGSQVKPSLYLYGRIVNNTQYTFKLTEKRLSGDGESWDSDKPVPLIVPPYSTTNPYFGLGAWGQAQMVLVYRISKDGGEPLPDAFGFSAGFSMSMVQTPSIGMGPVGSNPDPSGFSLKCDETGAWHYDGTWRLALRG